MKIFKSDYFPTESVFVSECESYKVYYRSRQRGENVRPQEFHPLVKEYISACLLSEQQGRELPQVEFINLTEEEWTNKEQQEENQAREEEDRRTAPERARKAEEEAREQRKIDLIEAGHDAEFKKEFIRTEMNKAGFTIEELVIKDIESTRDGMNHKEFWDSRRKTLDDLENEIKNAREE